MDQNYSVKSQMSVKSSVNSRFLGLSGAQCVDFFLKKYSYLYPCVNPQIYLKDSHRGTIMKENINLMKIQVLKN
jgi:hypothetical protein